MVLYETEKQISIFGDGAYTISRFFQISGMIRQIKIIFDTYNYIRKKSKKQIKKAG